MAKVLVVAVTGLASVSNLKTLKRAFADPYFDFIQLDLKDVDKSSKERNRETTLIRKALQRASKLDETKPVIVVSDRMTTQMTSPDIRRVVKKAINIGNFDLMYLSRFMDMCQLMTQVDPESTEGPQLMKTMAPQGCEALLYMPSGRDMILGKRVMHNAQYMAPGHNLSQQLRDEIYVSNVVAICTSPNLLSYDIVHNARRNEDFLKCNECLPIDLLDAEHSKISDNGVGYKVPGFLWFLFITIIILIVAWAVWQLYPGPKTSAPENGKKKHNCADYGGGNNPEIANHNGGDHSMWKMD